MKKLILFICVIISLVLFADPTGKVSINQVAGLTPVLNGKAPLNSPAFTGTVTGITPAMVGLGSASNTSDLNKPISTATQTALDLKANKSITVNGQALTANVILGKPDVGLSNVDNTSDVNKPISTAVQNSLNLYSTTTVADSRYNLVANNLNPYNYVYKKTQTDSIAAVLNARLASPTFTGATSLTTAGDIQCGGGFYVNGTTGMIQSYQVFNVAASSMILKVGGNNVNTVKITNAQTDAKPSIWEQFGDATNKALIIRGGNAGAPLDRYTLSSTQTLITNQFIDGSAVTPLSNSIFGVNNGASALFNIYPTVINSTVPLTSNNLIDGYATTVTAAGTTTLVLGSAYQQYFTGTTTQTVVLPVITTLYNGIQYQIVNNSTGTVTVQSSGLNTVVTLVSGTSVVLVCGDITQGTGAGAWGVSYSGLNVAAGKKATINNTITLAGTDASTYTFPGATKTIAANDGSNLTISGQAIGDIPIASSTTAYGKLADVATGSVLTSGGVGANPTWNASPAMTAPTVATTAAIGATTSAINGSWARLYTQPMYATPTVLTAAATITWTPTVGTNIYTLTPTSATAINMGVVPAGCVGSEILLYITTSGTSGYTVTFGTNLKSQGVLTTSTTTGMIHLLRFVVLSTTLVAEQGARGNAE